MIEQLKNIKTARSHTFCQMKTKHRYKYRIRLKIKSKIATIIQFKEIYLQFLIVKVQGVRLSLINAHQHWTRNEANQKINTMLLLYRKGRKYTNKSLGHNLNVLPKIKL